MSHLEVGRGGSLQEAPLLTGCERAHNPLTEAGDSRAIHADCGLQPPCPVRAFEMAEIRLTLLRLLIAVQFAMFVPKVVYTHPPRAREECSSAYRDPAPQKEVR
jgi:hypothetical protein